jgi:DNA-binding CsgD family transcriptional regulator
MMKMGITDSALYYGNKANRYFQTTPYGNGSLDVDEMRGEIFLNMPSADYKIEGISYLKRALAAESDTKAKANIYLKLAEGFIKMNQERKGENMLDSMYTLLKSYKDPVYLPDAYKFALGYYLKKDNAPMIKRYAAEYLKERTGAFNSEVAKKLSQFTVKYDTEKKEQQLRIVQYELRNKELHLQLYVVLTIILILTLMGCISFIMYKRRIYVLHQQLMNEKLNQLSEELNITSAKCDVAEKELNDLLSDMTNKQTLEAVTPELYKNDGEGKFRSRFNKLHPSFLHNLKEIAPDLSNREEIFCMLVALNQTTDQIIEIFCIEKKSINMMRYRIRTKIHLQRNESFEEKIKSLM